MAGKQANGKADDGAGDNEVVLTPVGDGADPQARASEASGEDEVPESSDKDRGGEGTGEDRRAGTHEEDDLGGEGEGEGGEGGTRQRPRLSRSERNSLRRRSKERDRTEIRFLRTRNEQLERATMDMARRLDGLEKGQLDTKAGQIKGAIAKADATIIRATAAGDEASALEAASLKNNLTENLRLIEERRSTAKRTEPSGGGAEQPEGLPPAVVRNVQNWMERNEWFDPNLSDRDSRIARALDEELLAEGEFDPSSPEYYRELDARIAEERPHLAKGGRRGSREEDRGGREEREERGDRGGEREERGKQPAKGGGPRFRVGGQERTLKANEVLVTAERRRALEEMGAWEDPKLRNRYLASYAAWDKQQAAESNNR